MRAAGIVAIAVFRESVRDKIFYNLVLFAVLLVGASILIGQLTAGQDVKIIKDLGLAAISIFGHFIAIFIGIGLVWKEVEKRSIYTLLPKPMRRQEFLLGKYFGLALTLVINIAVMTAAFYAMLAYLQAETPENVRASWASPATDPAMLKAIALIMIELLLVTAIALFFSTFSSPFLSAMLTLAVWVIGHFNQDLRDLGGTISSPVAAALARGVYYVVPNFAAFDVKLQAVHAQPIPLGYLALTSLYGITYVAFVLLGGVIIFSKRDFK